MNTLSTDIKNVDNKMLNETTNFKAHEVNSQPTFIVNVQNDVNATATAQSSSHLLKTKKKRRGIISTMFNMIFAVACFPLWIFVKLMKR